jgi:hypothetical protein
MRRVARTCLVVAGLAVTGPVIGACSSSSSGTASTTTTVGTPLTASQASTLASVLTKNFEAGGAEFAVRVPYGPTSTFFLDGRIDYSRHLAEATLRSEVNGGAETSTSSLFWSNDMVLEEVDGLTAEMSSLGRQGVKFLARPITKSSAQDIVLAFLLATASEQRENPQLLQQGTARFLRNDTINGEGVDVFRFGERTIYWVRQSDGVLLRVEATLAVAEGVTTIDLSNHGAVTIPGPLNDEVIDAAEVPADVLKRLMGGQPTSPTGPASAPVSSTSNP